MRILMLILFAGLAGCTLPKYSEADREEVAAFDHLYIVRVVDAPDGQFDVLVMNGKFRWLPDPMQIRQEYMAIGRQRAVRQCAGREAEMIDLAKPWADAAGLEMRFRCK